MSAAEPGCRHRWVNGREDPEGSGSYLTDCAVCGKTRRFGVGCEEDQFDALLSLRRGMDLKTLKLFGIDLPDELPERTATAVQEIVALAAAHGGNRILTLLLATEIAIKAAVRRRREKIEDQAPLGARAEPAAGKPE